MPHLSLRGGKYYSCLSVFVLTAALVCVLFSTSHVFAANVTIDDQARVLDANQVQTAAAQLTYATLIDTTKTFSGDQDALNQATRKRLPDQNSIAISIDTVQRHVSIQSGTSVPLSDSQASDAVDAFKSNFNNGDYTGATVAAINSLANALNPGTTTSPNGGASGPIYTSNDPSFPQPTTSGPDNGSAILGVIVFVVLGGVVLLLIIMGIRRGMKDDHDDPPWRGPRGGHWYDSQNGEFERGAIVGSMLEESQQHHHHEHSFGSGFGGSGFDSGASSNFGGGFDSGGSSGGGAGGSF